MLMLEIAGYVWCKNSGDEDSASLYEGKTKLCSVYKLRNRWYLKIYHFGESRRMPLTGEFASLIEAERAVTDYLYNKCVSDMEKLSAVKDSLSY